MKVTGQRRERRDVTAPEKKKEKEKPKGRWKRERLRKSGETWRRKERDEGLY